MSNSEIFDQEKKQEETVAQVANNTLLALSKKRRFLEEAGVNLSLRNKLPLEQAIQNVSFVSELSPILIDFFSKTPEHQVRFDSELNRRLEEKKMSRVSFFAFGIHMFEDHQEYGLMYYPKDPARNTFGALRPCEDLLRTLWDDPEHENIFIGTDKLGIRHFGSLSKQDIIGKFETEIKPYAKKM